jgi:hypothetical protein
MHEFSFLEPHIREWGLATRDERLAKRLSSTFDELKAFHDAVSPHLEEIVSFLDGCDIDDLPGDCRRLAWMVLSLVEIDASVYYWKTVLLPHMDDPRPWHSKRSFYDTGP